MINQKMNIRCEAVFSEDGLHRYVWKRVWDKNKPLAAVVMLNPCQADTIITDTTTSLVVNNVARLEKFGGVVVLNLFSLLTSKLNFRWNSDEDLNTAENDEYIVKAAEECEIVILAWGKAGDTHQRIAARAERVVAMLGRFKDKLMFITDGVRVGLHPLTPSIRGKWMLVPGCVEQTTVNKATAVKENNEDSKDSEDSQDNNKNTETLLPE